MKIPVGSGTIHYDLRKMAKICARYIFTYNNVDYLTRRLDARPARGENTQSIHRRLLDRHRSQSPALLPSTNSDSGIPVTRSGHLTQGGTNQLHRLQLSLRAHNLHEITADSFGTMPPPIFEPRPTPSTTGTGRS